MFWATLRGRQDHLGVQKGLQNLFLGGLVLVLPNTQKGAVFSLCLHFYLLHIFKCQTL